MSDITAIEIQNAKKILPMLVDIAGISVQEAREDIFIVTEHSTKKNLSIVVDVEPTTVCLMMDIMEIPKDVDPGFYKYLLELNSSAVHGKFSIVNEKIILRENLQIENLNQNELEKAIEHMFLIVAKNFKNILSYAHIDTDETYEYNIDDIDETCDLDKTTEETNNVPFFETEKKSDENSGIKTTYAYGSENTNQPNTELYNHE